MRLAACALAIVAGCAGPTARRADTHETSTTCGDPGRSGVARDDHGDVVAAALARFVADPETMPDVGLLPDHGPIRVLVDSGDPPDVCTLRAIVGRPFIVMTESELLAESRQIGDHVTFIRFFDVAIDGLEAQVRIGVDVIVAEGDKQLCCCSAFDRYRKVDGAWRFVTQSGGICR